MFRHILVPLDGSSRAESILPIAARIARFTQGSLLLFRAVLPPLEVSWHLVAPTPSIREAVDEEIAEATTYLAKIAQSPALAGISVKTGVQCVEPEEAIPSLIDPEKIDLVVMRSRGYTGMKRFVLGSVARSVMRQCSVPVLVVPDGSHLPADIEAATEQPIRILVALDGSTRAEAILPSAAYLSAALSAPYQGTLHLIHILHIPSGFEYGQKDSVSEALEQETPKAMTYLREVAQRLQTGDLSNLHLQTTIAVGHDLNTAKALLAGAEDEKLKHACDLFALATHGKNGWQLLFKGSVAERLFGASQLPLLIQCVPA